MIILFILFFHSGKDILTASELHSNVWGQCIIIKAIVPIRVCHEDWVKVHFGRVDYE